MADQEKIDYLNDSGESKQQQAYQQIKQDILNNTYPEGTVFVERKLCEIYNVSRSPIRNAIQQLTHEGLLTYIPGKGVTVAGFSIEDIIEVYDLIELLQLYAARSIIAKPEAYILDFLRTCVDHMKKCLDDNDTAKSTRWDHKFHQFFISCASNKRLGTIYDQLSVQSQRFIATISEDESLAKRSYLEHCMILENLEKHDLAKTEESIRIHYKNIKQYYVNKLIEKINL